MYGQITLHPLSRLRNCAVLLQSAMVAEGAEDQAHPLQAAAASACATIVSDGMMTPADVVKQRMQVTLMLGPEQGVPI